MVRSFMFTTLIVLLVAINLLAQPVQSMPLLGSESAQTASGGEFTTFLPLTIITPQPLFTEQISSSYHASIGHDGLPFITYHDLYRFQTNVAHCLNAQCSQFVTSVLTTTTSQWGNIAYTAIDNNGLGVILLRQTQASENTVLALYRCTNRACTTSTRTLLDQVSADYGIGSLGLAINSQNMPIILYAQTLYSDDENEDIERFETKIHVINCQDLVCATRTNKTIKTLTAVRQAPRNEMYQNISLLINQQSLNISYQYTLSDYPDTLNQIYLLHCATYDCDQPEESLVASYSTNNPSYWIGNSEMIKGPTNNPLFTFNTNAGATLLSCSDERCQNSTSSVLQSQTAHLSIRMNQQHNLFVYNQRIYDGRTIDFRFCETIACEPTFQRLNTTDPMFYYATMLFKPNGYPTIIQWNPYIKNLYVLNCASLTCETP